MVRIKQLDDFLLKAPGLSNESSQAFTKKPGSFYNPEADLYDMPYLAA